MKCSMSDPTNNDLIIFYPHYTSIFFQRMEEKGSILKEFMAFYLVTTGQIAIQRKQNVTFKSRFLLVYKKRI